MPAYKDETIEYHKERIRDLIVLKPDVSAHSIREALQSDPKNPLILDRKYIGKLLRKIDEERKHRFDKVKVEKNLAIIEDETQNIISQFWGILLDNQADAKARVMAGKGILDAIHKLLEAKMAAGIFERKLGTVQVEHQHTLSPEIALPILRALQNYGIVRTTATIIESKPAEFSDAAASGTTGE